MGVHSPCFHCSVNCHTSGSNKIENLFFSETSSNEQCLADSAAAAPAADGDESRDDEIRSDAKSHGHLCV